MQATHNKYTFGAPKHDVVHFVAIFGVAVASFGVNGLLGEPMSTKTSNFPSLNGHLCRQGAPKKATKTQMAPKEGPKVAQKRQEMQTKHISRGFDFKRPYSVLDVF